MTTIGGMTLPRLGDHPEASARLRQALAEAIDALAMSERDDGPRGAPGTRPTPADAEIHAFSARVAASALPGVLDLLDDAVANVVLEDAPGIADH